jgi:hypothetical protein
MSSSLAEVAGCILGGFLISGRSSTLRVRLALLVVNILPAIGAVGILICQAQSNSDFTAYFVLLTSLGIGASFVVQSSITLRLF